MRLLCLIFFMSPLLGYADWEIGHSIKGQIEDAQFNIRLVLEENTKILPFDLLQKLEILNRRISKHVRWINRSDEESWMKHDIFLINDLKKEWAKFSAVMNYRVEYEEEMFKSLDELVTAYKTISLNPLDGI